MAEVEEQKKKRKRFSANQVRIAVARIRNGEPAQKVADDLGVHFTTVHGWNRKAAQKKYRTHNDTSSPQIKGNVTPQKRSEIATKSLTEGSSSKDLREEINRLNKIIDRLI